MIRRLHTTAKILKNPYYFYDLQRLQGPPANQQKENAQFSLGRKTFDPLANQAKETMQERVKRVFGELGSREESRKEQLAKSINVAGINVPARPEEPTNCCMSGCVNCVWELYKDELDEYRQRRTEARKKLSQPEYNHVKWPVQLGPEPANRHHNTDRAHQEVQQAHEEEEEDDLNTGIKVFIETERKIQARKRARQETQGRKASAEQSNSSP